MIFGEKIRIPDSRNSTESTESSESDIKTVLPKPSSRNSGSQHSVSSAPKNGIMLNLAT